MKKSASPTISTLKNKRNEKIITLQSRDSPFGVLEFLNWNHPWNSFKYPDRESLAKIIALMKDAGVGWVRMDFLWEDIEPQKGQFQFEKYDTIVDLLTKNNIRILGLFNYCVDWAAAGGQWNNPPADNKFFVNYGLKVIERYQDRIKHWEVWNEPDSAIYWLNQDGLKSYCLLLKDVYQAAKKLDPECKILNGGFAKGILSVSQLYDNGAKGYFDILNIHVFEYPQDHLAIKRAKDYIKLAYKVMKRNDDGDKKIWITEIGCPGVKNGLGVNNWWMGLNPDEEQQGLWLDQVFTHLIKEEPVEKMFWAFFRDTDKHWDNGVDYFGLVRWDYSPKPAFFSYRNCSHNWNK